MKKKVQFWHNYDKMDKFSDAKKTRKIDAFFSKQKSSETLELQSKRRSSSSDMVIHFMEQSKSRPSASTSLAENQFTHVAESQT